MENEQEKKQPVPPPDRAADAESGEVEGTVAKRDRVAAGPTEPIAKTEESPLVRAAYEHPLPIRITHWANAISLFVLVASGLRIFRAFPSFGPKIPEKVLLDIPKSLTLGGWLGGALQWHFTFMWFFAASGVVYVAYQVVSGHYRTMLFTPRDIPGVWPMTRHYFFFGPKPPATGQYNPLQKLAYTSTIAFGALALLTGIVLYKPVQFSWLAFRISSCARVAFRGDVRLPRIYSRTPDHGCAAWLGKFLFHAFRMEARAGVSGVTRQSAGNSSANNLRNNC
jgi:thiosulfate reductase cytochrome b subunit